MARVAPCICIVLVGLWGTSLSAEEKKETDNLAESSVTSYSTVVIHHPQSKYKKGLGKDNEEGRSQAYFKVKKLRASTVAPQTAQQNGQNGRPHNSDNSRQQIEKPSDFRPSKPDQSKTKSHKVKDSEFRPSQYIPESEVPIHFYEMKDQSGQGASHTAYVHDRERNQHPENRRYNHKEEHGNEPAKRRQLYNHRTRHPSEEPKAYQKIKQDDTQFHREVFINHDYQPKYENPKSNPGKQNNFSPSSLTFDAPNAIPAVPVQRAHPFQHFSTVPEQRLRPIPPPGMSDELIETLLSQQPQTFDSEPKASVISEPKKKSKGQSFKVGYSIGFGNSASDVVMGKPKDARLHVNGRNSVWKNLPQGVQISQELDKNKPIALKLQSDPPPLQTNENVLKNDVYYVQNFRPDTSVPTSGKGSFNHVKALTNSNSFDFSNAVEDPAGWLKQGRAIPQQLDMSSIYQSLGYPPPLPVLLPGGPRGEGTVVHAIVIPIDQLGGFDYNWANLAQVPMVPISGQPVAQALTLTPVVTTAPILQTQTPSLHTDQQRVPHNHQPSPQSHQPHNHQSVPHNHQPVNPDKLRYRLRAPKNREFPPLKQVGSFSTAPIVVAPAPASTTKRQSELQQELNNILAEEMMRKNNRVPATGLRPPPPSF